MRSAKVLKGNLKEERLQRWTDRTRHLGNWMTPKENINGYRDGWATWKTLNRLRTGVGRTKDNLVKWGVLEDGCTKCVCGCEVQTMSHILSCGRNTHHCDMTDLVGATSNAISVARLWSDVV